MILEAEKPAAADEFNPLLSAEARLDNAAERLGVDDGMRKVLRSPAIGSVLVLGLLLLALFALWLFAASFIYTLTLGPDLPVSAATFARDVLTTQQGWTMIVVGMGVGFLFALAVLVISVVSFPLLLDRNVGVYCAVATSLRAVRQNPGPMAAWGLIIAAGLVIGTIPLLVGLAIVLPILGHATWHLYRKVVGH